jgi:hypothetical protein
VAGDNYLGRLGQDQLSARTGAKARLSRRAEYTAQTRGECEGCHDNLGMVDGRDLSYGFRGKCHGSRRCDDMGLFAQSERPAYDLADIAHLKGDPRRAGG